MLGLDEVDQTGQLCDVGHVVVLVQRVQVDAIHAAGAILVDLVDGILDTGGLEAGLLAGDVRVERLLVERVREDPVLGDDLAELAVHDAAVAAKGHVDGRGLIEDRHDAHVDRQPDARAADGVEPVTERIHIPAELADDEVGAVVLLLLQERDVSLEAAALDVAFRRASDRDGELVTELFADELDQLGGIVQVAVGAGPAEGQVAAQGEHVVDAVIQIGLQLFLDVFLGVADAGEVGNRGALAILLDLVQNFQILADVGAAGAVSTGNIVRLKGVEFVQNSVLAAQLFHAHVRLGRENLEGECCSLFVDVCYAHNCLHIQNRLPEWLHAGIKPAWIRYKIIVSHLADNYKTCSVQIYEKKHFFLHS